MMKYLILLLLSGLVFAGGNDFAYEVTQDDWVYIQEFEPDDPQVYVIDTDTGEADYETKIDMGDDDQIWTIDNESGEINIYQVD